MSRATTKNTALDGRQPIVKQKFRLRQLHGAGASRRWCRILPRLVQPLRAICASRSETELFALPGLKFPVDSVSIPRRAPDLAKKWPRQARRNVPEVGMSHLRLQFPKAKLGDLELRDSLAREFPQILRRIRELGMEFIFAEPA
ncbi:hypothetical protein KY285_000729 [Solanum tuberosum]|nr:hypothetical protein KY285_000729 [Solanum tuberosum]